MGRNMLLQLWEDIEYFLYFNHPEADTYQIGYVYNVYSILCNIKGL